MKNKKLLFIIIAAVMLMAAGITAFATGSFKMTYNPGTEDTVTNMPVEADWAAGSSNTVASNIPERDGYEFMGWKLDYETEPAAPQYVTLTINSVDLFGEHIRKDVIECELIPNESVILIPAEIKGYAPIDPPLTWDPSMGYEITFTYIYVGTEG